MTEKYFHDGYANKLDCGFTLGARGAIALRLLEHFAVVAGKSDREDSQGRSILDLQTPLEVVDRTFQIADLFVTRAEKDGEIEKINSKETVTRLRKLEDIKYNLRGLAKGAE